MVRYSTYKLRDDLYLLRFIDDETRYFEGLWEIPEGIMYNSYILTSDEGAVVFDTWKKGLDTVFLDALRGVLDPGKDVKYIVVHHMEPDHSGALSTLIKESNPLVLGHPLVKGMIESFYGITPRFKPVSDGEKLVFDGKTIVFHHTPWLHWPETIMTSIIEDEVLLSCDAFGAYGVFSEVWIDELDDEALSRYWWYMRKYFANVIGMHHEWVVKNLEKLSSRKAPIRHILPSHGLLLRGRLLQDAVDKYMKWGAGIPEKGKTLIVYTSMYGFVEKAVRIIEEHLSSIGAPYTIMGFTDKSRPHVSDVIGEAYDAENIVLASATYDADLYPLMKHVASLIAKKAPGKKVAIIALYGWGGKAGKALSEIVTTQGSRLVGVVEFRAGEEEKYRDKIIELVDSMTRQ